MPQRRIEGRSPAIVEPNVAASGPAELLKPLAERAEPSLCFWIVLGNRHQDPDPAHLIGLLRARRERPRGSRAAEQRDEVASLHSITSSARSRNDSGIVSLSALAVVRLRARSNFLGCSTGRS